MSERLPLDELNALVHDWLRRSAVRLGLNADIASARYLFNWGGFVAASFHLTDGAKAYHLKLADDPEQQQQLAQWRELGSLLASRYHAPAVLEWVEIDNSGWAGLLLEHIPGEPADLPTQPHLLSEVLGLLRRLHADAELAGWLLDGEQPAACWEYFLSVYIDRFDEDLRVVAADLPPFVPLALFDWMASETRELEGLARDMPAFQGPAAAPVHGDLWSANVLVEPSGGWKIIDWDDLAPGDPALEYGIVLSPLWRSGSAALGQLEELLPNDPALRERFALCLRATLLDEVIDSLADWVESAFVPEQTARVRAEKQRVHQSALALYQKRFGVSAG